MVTESDAYRRSGRRRILWSLLASAMLHVIAAVTLSNHLAIVHNTRTAELREKVLVFSSSIRIERRTAAQPPKREAPQRTISAPEGGGSLSAPQGWEKQDFGNIAETNVTLWLDWKKQTADFVPRLFLWQKKEDPDMPQPSLKDAVADVLSTLHAEDDRVFASEAQRVCGGETPGWFLSYVKPSDDPPLHFEETLFVAGATIYRATYIRPVDQPEDAKAREALNTLC